MIIEEMMAQEMAEAEREQLEDLFMGYYVYSELTREEEEEEEFNCEDIDEDEGDFYE